MPDEAHDGRNIALNYQVNCWCARLSKGTILPTSVVLQGTVLGPLLFLIYINDLANAICHPSIRLLPDNCVLFKAARSASDCEGLQENLSNIQSWCTKWHLQLNLTKCEAVNVTNK